MRRQSSRIFWQGVEHCEVFYQGRYHDAMWLNGVCIWQKLSAILFPVSIVLSPISAAGYFGNVGGAAYLQELPVISGRNLSVDLSKFQGGTITATETKTFTKPTADWFTDAVHYAFAHKMRGGLYVGTRYIFSDDVKDADNIMGYITLDGSTWKTVSAPSFTVSNGYPRTIDMCTAHGLNRASVGRYGQYIVFSGGAGSSKTVKCMVYDTQTEQSWLIYDTAVGASTYYFYDLCNDEAGNLYALSTNQKKTYAKLERITGITSGGIQTEEIISQNRDIRPRAALSGYHTCNRRLFYDQSGTFYTMGADGTATATSFEGSGSYSYFYRASDVHYISGSYKVLMQTQAGADPVFVGYRSADGITWTKEATVTGAYDYQQAALYHNDTAADDGIYIGEVWPSGTDVTDRWLYAATQ